MTIKTDTLREELCTFMLISRSILLGIRNALDKSCRENHNTYFVFSNFFFSLENRAFIMWKNKLQADRPQMTIKDCACALHIRLLRLQTHTQNV